MTDDTVAVSCDQKGKLAGGGAAKGDIRSRRTQLHAQPITRGPQGSMENYPLLDLCSS